MYILCIECISLGASSIIFNVISSFSGFRFAMEGPYLSHEWSLNPYPFDIWPSYTSIFFFGVMSVKQCYKQAIEIEGFNPSHQKWSLGMVDPVALRNLFSFFGLTGVLIQGGALILGKCNGP